MTGRTTSFILKTESKNERGEVFVKSGKQIRKQRDNFIVVQERNQKERKRKLDSALMSVYYRLICHTEKRQALRFGDVFY